MAQPEPPVFTGLFSVNGATRLYGTIGDPIRQLRMTGIMPQVFAAVGANAVWLPFEGGAPLLQLMLDGLRGKLRNLAGFTVTIPHKTAILPLLDRVSPRAQAAGSVNMVKRDGAQLVGDIGDGLGFVRGLEAAGHRVHGASVWLVGLGGVGGAIAAALCEAGVGRLLVTELDDARADAAVARLSKFYPNVPVANVDMPPKGIHYAINATPLGLRPNDPLPFDPMMLAPEVLVAEVIMSPAETPLLQRARTHGRRIHHGRHTLDHQVPIYLDWFGIDAKGIDIVRLVRSIP
ncbi:MAG: shikimate dehydrogenase [Reyranella sp.]|uniref:shikimate dehydrogenase family protein n=1 Tax=Reyranella sp. TaxID=1929291 RepID=UPI001AD0A8E7|nr:hypothetical protein [Reyranella sp.]MBN9086869.1 shikimate dehydrogenase [Reyranella sp.]